MEVQSFSIEGPLLLTPSLFSDQRGFFFESWNARAFAAALGVSEAEAPIFLQDNHSLSRRGVLRGLHYQLPPAPQGKLVRCVAGEIHDVIVDLRRSSPSFGQSIGERLSAENRRILWVPPGFAHGFLTLSESAEVLYKASGLWNRSCERSILWNDATLAIDWPLAALDLASPIQSEKDANAAGFAAAELFP
ncbi:dTDP-4-dehydrorhamnose 3,5-epimerase [Synechococcus sp. CS-1325]|uniref:dTDP-4-dehydrorhamnose 3,5-epimerase n=1 Tax=Synechococcus sp. CS-1325 TaxID=2847979 RepID=UPI000DB71690|nr:dTDP-4-dehydrorhamnose 3,5-epimerase [Synechococcus sp. CS-1325]MCT0199457.1 dTDP-4-dehydrorhamnose 3,5-epimerase [Synechococcus sp. CS-1325]PZV03060.1 MAG: dTDP-4-dehydrorhamnose 3,5-epimerase [Cyanobium sp.]